MSCEVMVSATVNLSHDTLSFLKEIPELFSIAHSATGLNCGSMLLMSTSETNLSEKVKMMNSALKREFVGSQGVKSLLTIPKKPKMQPIQAAAALGKFSAETISSPLNASTAVFNQTWQEVTSAEGRLFLCKVCAYRSNKSSNIKRHSLKHEENVPKIQCSQCDTCMKDKTALKGHYMKVHRFTDFLAKAAVEESVHSTI